MTPSPATDSAAAEAPIHILIVDDEPGNLVVLEAVLDHPGYRWVRAASANQALLALLAHDFALLILDIRMPGLSGIELAGLIRTRKRNAQVPIIFLTAGSGEPGQILEGYGTGAVDYLLKPFNPAILRSKVAVFAELHHRQLALLAEVARRRQAEAELRAFTHRVVQGQEDERAHLALELHDHITQLLCAVLVRSEALAGQLAAQDGPIRREARQLRDLLGRTAEDVERISRELRPGALDLVGLVAVLQSDGTEFARRTGVAVMVDCGGLSAGLPAGVELSLYRIVQKALRNVEQHAHAHHLTLALSQTATVIILSLQDDGIGCPAPPPAGAAPARGLGLLRMRERANSVGGTLTVTSAPNAGTRIEVRIPLSGLNEIPPRGHGVDSAIH